MHDCKHYLRVRYFCTGYKFLACDLISYSPGDRITPNVHFIAVKNCFTVMILQDLHHKFVTHGTGNLPCALPKRKHNYKSQCLACVARQIVLCSIPCITIFTVKQFFRGIHLTRVDSLPRSFGSPLEARRQLAMLCYSVNRLGKLLMTRIRDNLLQSTASGGSASAVLGGPPLLDDQMLDVNASTGVSVSSSTSILSVIEALLFKNNANTTAVSEQNMVHFSAFVDLAERAFFPTEQKQLGILKIPKVKEIFSADGTQLLDRIHSQGDNMNNFPGESGSGPLDGLSNAQNLFLITKREFLSNIFKMLTGRPAFLADMPNQKVHVDEIATALCDVSSSQLLKLRTMVLQKYNSFEAAFQDLKYKEEQEEADGTKAARGHQTGKNNTTSLGRNVELAKSAGIEIQEFVTRENLVKAYLELVHDRNLAEESATSTAPATPGGVDDTTLQQRAQFLDGAGEDQDGFQVDGRSGSKSETKKKEIIWVAKASYFFLV